MKISKAQAEENRRRVLAEASRLFRERGFDGVAVGDLMKSAGFTHGGFYNHFTSKADVERAALRTALDEIAAVRARARDLEDLLTGYLSEAARNAPGKACPIAALAGDAARADEAVKVVFAKGLEEMITAVSDRLPENLSRRSDAIDLVTRMVGALILSRATPAKTSLSSEILATALRSGLETSHSV